MRRRRRRRRASRSHESHGGFAPGAVALLYDLSRKHGGERLGAEADAATANVRSFRARHAMKINVAIIAAAAGEMLETIRLDVAAEAEA